MTANNAKSPAPLAGGTGQGSQEPQINSKVIISQQNEENKPNYWAVIPASVRYDKGLKPNAKLLYGEISSLANKEGYCWASNDYFADLYDLSKDHIGKLLAQLEGRGYITREIVRDETTNAVVGRKIWLGFAGVEVHTPPVKNNGTSRQKCGDPPVKKNGENNININTIPPISPKGEEQVDKLFENFWTMYPARHGRKNGKKQAREIWQRLKVTPALNERILAGLDAYLSSDEVRRGYAMDASRWLRGRRWEDEVIAPDSYIPAVSGGEVLDDTLGGLWDG